MVRSSKIEVFGMATVGRGYNKLERRRVFKTLLDAGVESTRELSEHSGLCKAPNETKKRKRKDEKVVEDSKTRPIMTPRASSSNFERSCNSKLFQSW